MKKLSYLAMLSVFGLSMSALSVPAVQADEVFKAPYSQTILEKKRCEKCKRGADGKMVCEPVPCD